MREGQSRLIEWIANKLPKAAPLLPVIRVVPQVLHGPDEHTILLDGVVDAIGKPLDEEAPHVSFDDLPDQRRREDFSNGVFDLVRERIPRPGTLPL